MFLLRGSAERGREKGALACVIGWTNIPSEVLRLFTHGAGTGVSCGMLRFVWLPWSSCGFFGSAADRRASAISFILDELAAILQKSSIAWSASKRCSWHAQAA